MAKNPQPLPKYVTDLINTYTNSQQSLIKTIATKKAKGNVIAYQQDLLQQVDIEIRKLNLYAISWANGNLPTEYINGVNDVNRFLEGIGQPTQSFNQFAQLHNRAVSVLVQNATDDLINANNFVGRRYKDSIRQATIDAISQKISTGANIRDTRNDIMNRLISTNADGVRTRNGRLINLRSYAETVARSTTREATNTATLNHLSATGRDLVKMSNHNSSCKICAPLEGRVYSISGNNKDFPPLNKAYSGTHMNIHPNCFVEGTLVTSPPIESTSMRNYTGEIIVITTTSGNEVTVTPNHPILTPKGWVNAGELREGQQVVENRFADKPATLGVDPDNIDIPTRIEDVIHSFEKSISVSAVSVKVSPEDFHGDGANSEICIINSDSFLRDKFNFVFDENIRKSFFVNTCDSSLTFDSQCFFQKTINRLLRTSKRIISRFSKRRALFWCHSLQSCFHRLASVFGFRESIFSKSKRYNGFVNTKEFCDRFLGFSRLITVNNFIKIRSHFIRSLFVNFYRSKQRKFNTFFSKSLFENSLADIEDGRYLLDRISKQVQFTDIVQVDRKFFHGKVYNLQTKNNWYVANNIITHNCRHVITPYIESLAEEPEKDKEFSNRPFDTDPRSQAEIDRYNNSQKYKADLNRDRKQWQKYKMVMPNETPKTLSGFRTSKKSNSDNFKKLQSNYRSIRYNS